MVKQLFLSVLGAILLATEVPHAECSVKFTEAYTCDSLAAKSGEVLMYFTVGLKMPHPSEENSPQSMENLRKWTDSLFEDHDLRGVGDPTKRLLSPPDSLLSWYYPNLMISKNTILTLVERPYILRLEYHRELQQTAVRKKIYPSSDLVSKMRYFNILGQEQVQSASPHPSRILLERRKESASR